MRKTNAIAIGTLAILVLSVSAQAFAQYDYPGSSSQKVTKEQLQECKTLGIPEFTCTEQTLLAKRRTQELEMGGSGTPMFGKGFGDMGAYIGILAAIFGGVAVAFFARAKVGKKVAI